MKGYEGMESTIGPMARSLDSLNVFMEAVIGAEPAMYDSKVAERVSLSTSSVSLPLQQTKLIHHCGSLGARSRPCSRCGAFTSLLRMTTALCTLTRRSDVLSMSLRRP
jgi:hypothetical protein